MISRYVLLRSLIFFGIGFSAWGWLSNTLIAPTIQVCGQIWLDFIHPEIYAQLRLRDADPHWSIEASLFKPMTDWVGGTALPGLELTGATIIPLPNLTHYSLGFPLSWILHCAFWHLRWWPALLSHFWILVCLLLATSCSLSLAVISATSTADGLMVYHDDHVYSLRRWPTYTVDTLQPTLTVFTLLSALIVPACSLLLSLKGADDEVIRDPKG